jgi:hypothetical protein
MHKTEKAEQSEEQREVELMTAREYMRERRENQSEEQKEVERVTSRQRSCERRINQIEENDLMSQIAIERNSFIPIFTSDDIQNLDMTRNLNIENSFEQCLQKLSRTLLQPNE